MAFDCLNVCSWGTNCSFTIHFLSSGILPPTEDKNAFLYFDVATEKVANACWEKKKKNGWVFFLVLQVGRQQYDFGIISFSSASI